MVITKDILSIDSGIICHQVNCKGKMGAGIALKIRKKWPIVYKEYIDFFNSGKLQLGNIQTIQVKPNIYVGNLMGQYGYGRDKQYTDHEALKSSLSKIYQWSIDRNLQIYLPYKIGCGLAGGDWKIVKSIIYETITNPVICKWK